MYKLQMQLAIAEERFEDATALRDAIDRILASDRALRCCRVLGGRLCPRLRKMRACAGSLQLCGLSWRQFHFRFLWAERQSSHSLTPPSLVVAMETAIDDGRYDEAARLRDEFKALRRAQQLSSSEVADL